MEIQGANIDYIMIGERIRESRKKAGITQQQIAEIMDVSIAYLSRIERGTSNINLQRLAQLSVVLNVPIEYLISGVVAEKRTYLHKEFQEIMLQCSPDKQRLIYNIAKIVAGIKFV